MIVILLMVHKLIHVCLIWMVLVMSTSSKSLASKLILAFMTKSRMVIIVVDHIRKYGVEIGIRATGPWTAERWTRLRMHQSRTP